jgi:hypothetical protein
MMKRKFSGDSRRKGLLTDIRAVKVAVGVGYLRFL